MKTSTKGLCSLMDCRNGNCEPGYSYKLLNGSNKFDSAQFGFDVYANFDSDIDESTMSAVITFADGSRRFVFLTQKTANIKNSQAM